MCIVKKITVFCIFVTFGVTYPMKRFFEKDCFEVSTTDQCVTFKSLKGFPLTSLNKGAQWFALLSDTDKRSVTQAIINHNDERLKVLFNLVTQLPLELQRTCIQHLYSDDNQRNNFLHMPIPQAYCYEGSLDILNDEQNRNFAHQYWITPEPRIKPDVICNIAKEITVFCSEIPSGSLRKKNELEAVAKVVEAFRGAVSDGRDIRRAIPDGDLRGVIYQYSEPLTCKRFILKDLRYLPFFLSVFITLALPSFDVCGVNQYNVHFNEVANNFNAAVVCAYEQTGSKIFLEKQVALKDEHEYCPSYFLYMKIASWLSAIIPAYDVLTEIGLRRSFLSDKTIKKDVVSVAVAAFYLLMINAIAQTSHSPEELVVGALRVTGLYLLACAVYNAAIKKHTKRAWVAENKIPELLQRNDIYII